MSDVDYSAIPSTSKYVPPLYSRYTSDSLSISSKHNGCEDGSESSSISSLASCHESFQVDVKQNDDQTHLLLAAKKSFTSYGTSPGSLEKDLKPSPLIEAKKISTVPKLAPTNKFGPKAQQKMVLTSRMPDRPSLPYGHRPTKSLILTAIQTLIIIFLILFILKSYLFKIFTANSDTDIQKKLEQDEAEVREFFRNNGGNVEEHSFKKKFFSTAANKFECYSCMSTNYQDSWELLESIYVVPKTFTNRCNDPDLQNQERGGRNPMPTTTCSSFCVTLIESNFEGGVFISHKYIRGCAERIVLSGFNQTSIRTHRFNSMDTCRTLPRALIFNQPKGLDTPVYGDVRVCSCFGDGCNGGSNSSPTFKKMPSMNIVSFILILSIFVLNI